MSIGHKADTKQRTHAASNGSRVRRRLVASGLGTLPAGTYTDHAQPGLQLRVRGKGQQDGNGKFSSYTREWLLRIVFRGTETRLALGTLANMNLAEARDAAREL